MKRLTSIKVDSKYKPEIEERQVDAISQFKKSSGSRIAQTTAIGIIRKFIPKDAIAVGSAGSLPGCLQRM